MGRFEKRPDNPRVRGELSRAAETALWAVVEDLERLQQNVLRSLHEEIKRLQGEKTRLSDEIQELLAEKEHLQQVKQITGQQVLIRQLSEALAKHISSQLQLSLANLVSKSVEGNSHNSGGDNHQNAEQMLGTLNDTLTSTFNSLQQELKNYQNNLSQQLSRMQSQQQQGEAIVEELINHLRSELVKTKEEISPANLKASPPTILQTTEQEPPHSSQTYLQLEEITTSTTENLSDETISPSEPISVLSGDLSSEQNQSAPQSPSEPISVLSGDLSVNESKSLTSEPATKQDTKAELSQSSNPGVVSPIQIGFLLVVLSTVVSSLHNIVIKGMFYKAYDNSGVLEIHGIVSPSLGNILLILTLRLLVVVPIMLLLAPMMYPQVWQDMQSLVASLSGNSALNSGLKQRKTLPLSIASGCFLFLSQVLLYFAIGQVATGTAIALFFVYPMIGALLSWLLFRHRPSTFHFATIAAIFCGELLVLGGSPNVGLVNFFLGTSIAILAGVAFAGYVILTRICASKLHPVSFTLVNFTTMLLLSLICLILPWPKNLSVAVQQPNLLELILSAFILGVLTLLGYVLNNVGIRKLGALRATIIGAGVPILTVVFAGLILEETLTVVQIMGVLFVTFGVAAYSFEKMRTQVKPSHSEN